MQSDMCQSDYVKNRQQDAGGHAKDGRRIRASLAQWDELGTSRWCGYSFSWMSCLRVRGRCGVRLAISSTSSSRRSSSGTASTSTATRRAAAFPPSPTVRLRSKGIFWPCKPCKKCCCRVGARPPAIAIRRSSAFSPPRRGAWARPRFCDLRAEGGHRVSARRENDATTWFRIVAGKDGVVRIRDNFGGRTPQWSLGGIKKVGDNYTLTLKKGQAIEAAFAK